MAWTGFDGRAYTRAEFTAHVAATEWRSWKPSGICLHNTAGPTLKEWAESGPAHDARIRNLQSYYENEKRWHQGPHLFISRNYINGFSDLTQSGIHSRCFNNTHLGIECVGDYSFEEWDFGDGERVRDNAVFALAMLYQRLGLNPDGLVFHKECSLDNHDCPGRKVIKSDVIRRVKIALGYPAQPDENPLPLPPITEPWNEPGFKVSVGYSAMWGRGGDPRTYWAQIALNKVAPSHLIPEDGLSGPLTANAVRSFERSRGLTTDAGIIGPQVIAKLKAELAELND